MDYKRGDVYRYRFACKGELIRERARASAIREGWNRSTAKRTALAKGEVGIKEKPGATGADAFTMMRLMGHSSVAVSHWAQDLRTRTVESQVV